MKETSIQSNSKECKSSNYLLNQIVCKTKDNRFIIYIPCSIEKRKFKGIIHKNGEGSILRGRFIVPKKFCFVHLTFGIIVWVLLILMLAYVPALMYNNHFLILFIVAILLLVFDIWHLLIFRSQNYEGKIIDFLQDCLNGD